MTTKRQQQLGHWLIAALIKGRIERALELLRQGADLSVKTLEGYTALYAAIGNRRYSVVKALLEAGADPNVSVLSFGTYPLLVAAEYGGEEAPALLEMLIAHGARIDVRDEEGATAIFLAGKGASIETIQTLLRHGADISDRNYQRDTALTFASCWGMTDRAAMLLDAGIDILAQDDLGRTALHWAATNGHASTVALLLSRGAIVDVPDQWGRTALLCAAAHGSAFCVARLLDAGADPSAHDSTGRTALDIARDYAGRDLAEALLAEDSLYRTSEEPLRVERLTTPDGEAAVRVCDSGGWTRERCDGYDAIVQLLQRTARKQKG